MVLVEKGWVSGQLVLRSTVMCHPPGMLTFGKTIFIKQVFRGAKAGSADYAAYAKTLKLPRDTKMDVDPSHSH